MTEHRQSFTFNEHRDKTVADLLAVVELLQNLINLVRDGDMKAFERFWIEDGTEDGDARIFHIRDMLILRYLAGEEAMRSRIAQNSDPG